MSAPLLGRMLAPSSVAVIGASPTPGKAGNALVRSLTSFRGGVYPIHPTADEVHGRRVYRHVGELPETPDLALLAVPAPAVPPVLQECGDAGVAGAVVHAGGFAEAGGEGRRLQRQVAHAAANAGIRVLGPNTSGFLAPHLPLCASFVSSAATIGAGPLALIAQSGGVNHALAFGAHGDGLGIRLAVGLGNAVDISFADMLDYLARDTEVAVIALAIEGVADGRGLVEAVERLVDRVPIVALKAGRSDVSEFAQSHTGALTGSWKVARAALRRAGAVVVDDTTELLDAARALACKRLAPRRRPGVGLVTGQAGPGLLLADALGAAGVGLPELPRTVQDELETVVGSLTFRRNPVDTGRPGPSFPRVLSAVSAVPEIDLLAVYLLHEPDAVDPVEALNGAGTAVLGTGGSPEAFAATRDALAANGVPAFPTPERTAAAVAALVADAASRARPSEARTSARLRVPVADGVFASDGWDEDRAKRLIESIGIAVPARRVCISHEDALENAAAIGFPLVAKLIHPDLLHKTDAGAIHIDLRNATELADALRSLDRAEAPEGARYMIEAMAPPGPELLVGAIRDPAFGPLVVLGTGGVDAELADDTSTRLAPVSVLEAATMLDELDAAPRYRGHRGGATVDETSLARAIAAVSSLISSYDDIAELELNPLRVDPSGALITLDALVVSATQTLEAPPHE